MISCIPAMCAFTKPKYKHICSLEVQHPPLRNLHMCCQTFCIIEAFVTHYADFCPKSEIQSHEKKKRNELRAPPFLES